MSIRPALLAALALLAPLSTRAAVRLITGPTPIPGGSARAAADITVVNERLAFALAVQSPAPYGVPRGAIVDIAPVSGGQIGHDRVVFADFIPNNWSAWPNSYHHVEVLESGPRQVRIRAERDWGKARLSTVYTLRENADRIEISTTMTNEAEAPLPDLLSGLTLWPSSGFLFAVPGLAGLNEGNAAGALARRFSAYDAGWTVTLHAPYMDHVGDDSRDLFLLQTLEAHASRTFDGWLQVGASGDLAPVVAAEIEQGKLSSGVVRGSVRSVDGKPLAAPVVVIEKNGKLYAWALGHEGAYEMRLPVGDYSLYATGRNYSRSAAVAVTLVAGGIETRSFEDLRAPGSIEFSVVNATNGSPLDARISIAEGDKPLVQFLGRKTFFTELKPRGRASVPIAPGSYRFAVSSGAGVLSREAQVHLEVAPGEVRQSRVAITPLFDPPAQGWYAADLHHHADQAEAVTPPADLARSQLAAGLNLLFVSDHDSTVNHALLRQIAAARGVAFIPGIELSPSWGHFNAYPLLPGATLQIDTSTASVGEVLAEARREGATIVQANHPFIPYGYFSSVAAKVAPGGFAPGFDLVEINSNVPKDDPKVLSRLWEFWNAGQHYYLSGGSDTHDVWNEQSGLVRTFVHLPGAVTPEAFARGLKDGHAYVSYGPLIFPDVMFGTQMKVTPGKPFRLGFQLGSVAGLKAVRLIGDGLTAATRTFSGAPLRVRADFTLTREHPGWYALVVEDEAGRQAYSDPIWIALQGSPSAAVRH
jgi:hypothetical protein